MGEQKQTAQGEMFKAHGVWASMDSVGLGRLSRKELGWVGWSGEDGSVGDRIPTLRDHECAGEGKGGEKRNGGRRRRGTDGMGGHVLLLWGFVAGVLGDSIKRLEMGWVGMGSMGAPGGLKCFPGTREDKGGSAWTRERVGVLAHQ